MSKINYDIAQEIIDKYLAGTSTYDLAEEYGLWQTSVCNLVAGRSWPNCKRPENIKDIIYARKKIGLDIGKKKTKNLPPLNKTQMDLIIGSLLGDGSLSKIYHDENCSFSKTQKADRKEYLNWHSQILEPYSSGIYPKYCRTILSNDKDGKVVHTLTHKKNISGYVFHTYRHESLKALREKWYINNKKIVPKDIELNSLVIAIWFLDDGYNSYENREAFFCTQSFSIEDVDFLREKLLSFNIDSNIKFVNSKYDKRKMPIIRISKKSYDCLIELIKPHVLWNCFNYKIKWRNPKKQYEIHSKLTEEQVYEIFNYRIKGEKTYKELGEIYNMHPNSIQAICLGKNWKHLKGNIYIKEGKSNENIPRISNTQD
jgi:hypothetical protein